MLFFVNDYCEGAHEAILRRLVETNMEKLPGYGFDKYTESAKEKIRKACGCPGGRNLSVRRRHPDQCRSDRFYVKPL